jgi:hypothetical protein
MVIMTSGELDIIKVSDDALFERAVNDAIAAMMRLAVVGRSIPDAIGALDRLRQELEEARQP